MADARIGGASLHVGVNADKLVAGLNKAEGKVKEFGQKTKNIWEKIGERFGGGGGGFLAKSLGAGFFGGIAGSLAIRGMNAISDAVNNLISDSARWEAELARVQFRVQELTQHFDHLKKVRDEWTATMGGKELETRLKEDVARAKRMDEVARAAMETARQLNAEINSVGGLNFHLFMRGDLRRSQAEASQNLKNMESDATKTGAALMEAQEKLKRFDPTNDPAVKGGLVAYIKELDQSIAAFGKTVDEAKHKVLMDKGGPADFLAEAEKKFKLDTGMKLAHDADEYTKSLLKQADAVGKDADQLKILEFAKKAVASVTMDKMRGAFEAKKTAEMKHNVGEFTKSLNAQRMMLDMTENAAKLYAFRMEGATKAQLMGAAVEAELLEMLGKKRNKFEPKFAAAMEVGSKEAHSLELKHRFGSQGADPNKGVTLWDLNVAMLKAAATLQKIEAKVGKAGVL